MEEGMGMGKEGLKFGDEFERAQQKFLGAMPTPEHFMNLIDSMKDISSEEKQKLKDNILDRIKTADKFKDMFGAATKKTFDVTFSDYMVFLVMIIVMALVIGKQASRYQLQASSHS